MMTDPIADMLTRIRNAQAVRQAQAVVPFSKLKQKIASLLARERYLENVTTDTRDGRTVLVLTLKYEPNGRPTITGLKRVSRPGRRIYCGQDELPTVLNNYGLAVISTNAGLLTNKEARRRGLGGEIICEVY